MFNAIIAVGAGFLLGNKEARIKVDKILRNTLGSAIDLVNKKKAVNTNEVTDKSNCEVRSTSGSSTSTGSV